MAEPELSVDHIIIGGGAAGCVLAARLSERADRSVVLIEAGPDTPPGQEPAAILDSYPIVAYFDRTYQWSDLRVSLDRASDPKPGTRRYEQAKVLGGGTSINGMFAYRGLPWDFEDWVAAGATGWGWLEVLPYFRRLERDLDFDDDMHGDAGPMPIRRLPRHTWPAFSAACADAAEALGFQNIQDHNGVFSDGFFPMCINNEGDQRVSAARGYLTAEVRRRPNLHLFTETTAVGLLTVDRQVVGVETDGARAPRFLRAREVTVAAGALHSPALLMRAGIGPAAELQAAGVPVLVNRRGVGRNLQDHPMVALAAYLRPRMRCPPQMRRHIHMGLRYSSQVPDCPPGDMFVLPSNRAGWHPVGRRLASILVCVNRPFSTGAVRLTGPDPRMPPEVDFRQLHDARDLIRLEQGLHLLYRIVSQPGLRRVIDTVFPATFSDRVRALGAVTAANYLQTWVAARILGMGPRVRRAFIDRAVSQGVRLDDILASPEAMRDWVRANACGSWHASGTCRIGDPADPEAVVDPSARVIGVDGLRVVDASIMPTVVSANTALTTMMAAEKVAAEITGNQAGAADGA